MRKICSECIHEDVCKDWEKGFTSFTGILPSNKELSCKNFAALSSGKPAAPAPTLLAERRNKDSYGRKI